mgnify:CR=1 FL=1
MTSLVDALQERISCLEDEQGELEDSLNRVVGKIQVLKELLEEESGETSTKKTSKGKPKKVKKSTKKRPEVSDSKDENPEQYDLFSQVSHMQGTPPDVAERLSKKKFTPTPRPVYDYGAGVHPGIGDPKTRRQGTK